jgi:hypothetical protein
MVDWCRRGPDLAQVDSVEAVPEDPVGDTAFGVSG